MRIWLSCWLLMFWLPLALGCSSRVPPPPTPEEAAKAPPLPKPVKGPENNLKNDAPK